MHWVAWALANLGLAAAVGLAIWITKSPWPLLGFVFAFSLKTGPTTCEKCGAKLSDD
jgi:hypothetical protein